MCNRRTKTIGARAPGNPQRIPYHLPRQRRLSADSERGQQLRGWHFSCSLCAVTADSSGRSGCAPAGARLKEVMLMLRQRWMTWMAALTLGLLLLAPATVHAQRGMGRGNRGGYSGYLPGNYGYTPGYGY